MIFIMRRFISLLMLLIWAWTPSASGSRMERAVECRDDAEYTHGDICCLNCPAGCYVQQGCTTASEKSVCMHCDFDTYTEHANGLFKCLQCTKCHPDQELVEQCTSTRNTRCQCKPGSFCLPDQACEVCKTCSKCKENEEVVESCTAHSNTICRKRGSTSTSASPTTAAVVSIVVTIVILVVIAVVLYWRCNGAAASSWPGGTWKTCIESGSGTVEARQNSLNGALEDRAQNRPFLYLTQPVGEEAVEEEEEDRGLGPSLTNTTASSQISLPVCAQPSECCLSRLLPQQLNTLENEKRQRLVPLNGEESLKKSFDLFAEVDVLYHNRFFRHIGLSDNAIRNAEAASSSAEDRVYELLKVWLEKEGMKADFNSLIDALLHLDQRLSAENISTRAVANDYFRCEED